MVKKESVIKNFAFQFIYQIFNTLIPFVTAPYLARTLGVSGIGIYAYNYAIAYYFVLLTKLGIDNYGAKEIARISENKQSGISKRFNELFWAKAIIGFGTLIAYICYVVFFVKKNRVVAWIFVLYIVSAIFDINWFYIGIENFRLIAIRNIMIKSITTICIFVFVKSSTDINIYTLIMVGGTYFFSQFIGWGAVLQNIKLSIPHVKDVCRHYKPLFSLFVPVLAMSIYRQMDKIMLGGMTDTFQVGLYEYTEKIYMVLMSIVSATGDVGMPRVVSLLTNEKREQALGLVDFFMDFGMCLSVAMTFGIAAISRHFIVLFYGNAFSECVTLFVVLAPTIIFLCISVIIRKEYLIPFGHEKVFIHATIIGAFINLILNFILIRCCAAKGAIIATLCTELFVMIFQIVYIRKKLPIKKYLKHIIWFMLAGSVMWIFIMTVWPQKTANWETVLLEMIVGAFIYIVMTVLFVYKCYRNNIKIFIERRRKSG